jgi:hypothetical protein
MLWSKTTMKSALAVLVLFSLIRLQSLCQGRNADGRVDAAAAQRDLSLAAEAEAKKGAYVFYTQHYVDKENQKAFYRGSIYGSLKTFELDGCSLKIDVVIVDKFSGIVGGKQTGDLADSQHYTFSLALTSEIAHTLALIEARPAQLGRATNSVCAEKPSCAFTWMAVQAPGPAIKESRVTNEFVDYRGDAGRFLIPLSSPDAGKQLIRKIQDFADARCKSPAIRPDR